ncbi:MAG: FkbM family methyltransferase [Pseudomonadota bacterium]
MSKLLTKIQKKVRRRRKAYLRNRRERQVSQALQIVERDPKAIDEVKGILAKFAPTPTGHKLIRIGPTYDGGYILPDDLEGLVALYSPGVSDTFGFDAEIAGRGIPCFLADGTIDQPSNLPAGMFFEQMMIGDGPAGRFMRLEDWVSRTAPESDGDLMLQMDIEGAEYDVLPGVSRDLLDRFRIIVLELHDLDIRMLGPQRAELTALLARLTERHVVCHVHPNNCLAPSQILGRPVPPILEVTLLRQDRIRPGGADDLVYPHPLDSPNIATMVDHPGVPFWT